MMNKREWPGCLKTASYRELVRVLARLLRRDKPVTIPDLEWELKRSNQILHVQTKRLEEEGYLDILGARDERKRLELTEQGRHLAREMSARVLGEVPAGDLRQVLECDGRDGNGEPLYLETYDEMLPPTEEFASFLVHGDSMIGDGILPGDRVHLELGVRLGELEQGEIAVVCVGDDYESTLKHVFYDRDKGTVTLRASNASHPDRVLKCEEVHVTGAYYGIARVVDKRNRRRRK